MFRLVYKNVLIEYDYNSSSHQYNGKVVGMDEPIHYASPSLSDMKTHICQEIDSLLTFNHKQVF